MKKYFKSNKGFILMETIIVMSILSIGLISLYSYFVIIQKNSTTTSTENSNSYIAYQILNYKEYTPNNNGYIEIYRINELSTHPYYLKNCNSTCDSPKSMSDEEKEIFHLLNIEKIYYTKNLKDLMNNPLLDGSTLNYLQSIKNKDEYKDNILTVIIKTVNEDDTYSFSYYQKEDENIIVSTGVSLLGKILGENYSNVGTPATTPGKQISTEAESVLAEEMDDYGITYYYRGAVENNYVVFANMCWRIVRITGNGSIKLVLYNEDKPSCNETGNLKAFAKVNDSQRTKFNPSKNVMAYVGFMYGNTNSTATNLTEIRQNNTDSTILEKLKTWYDNNLRAYDSKIADVIWCNDKSFYSESPTSSYADFSGYNRIEKSKTPILICPTIKGEELVSKFTSRDTTYGNGKLYTNSKAYKIGLLTADEVAFAGSANQTKNTSYYLYTNAKATWWTMTPDIFRSSSAVVYVVTDNGELKYGYVDSESYVRPAIALIKNVMVMGDGTATNPYKVIE